MLCLALLHGTHLDDASELSYFCCEGIGDIEYLA